MDIKTLQTNQNFLIVALTFACLLTFRPGMLRTIFSTLKTGQSLAQKFSFHECLHGEILVITSDNRSRCGGGIMDKIQFNNLSITDQACLLLDGGVLLATNSYYHYNVLLYSFHNQFMELVYDNSAKQVLLVRAVNENILQKYLDNINLEL